MIDMVGHKYGILTVLERLATDYQCLCLCECGNKTAVRMNDLRTGNTTSCGCLSSKRTMGDRTRKHGMKDTKVYEVWSSMRKRCNNPNCAAYKNYGGRGIKVCDRWSKFANFYEDMGEPNGLTIERVDNDGDYCPENCKWIPLEEQGKNKRCQNKFGIAGLTKRGNSYRARIPFNGKQVNIGSSMDYFEACCLIKSAENNLLNR